jgi:NAD(P)H-hydrate epimerase
MNDPIKKVKDFAKKYNIIVLLKGPTTVISDGEKVLLVNKGVPGMATAGSGDILSGILVGLLGYNKPDINTVASAAYINGYAGEIAESKSNSFSMIARNTIKCIPDAITKITK